MTTPTHQKPISPEAETAEKMKAMVYERYGHPEDVLQLEVIPRPVPGPDEVLLRVRASSVQPLDWHLLTGTPYLFRIEFGLPRPRRSIPGADIGGIVESVGAEVTRFAPGDEVFAEIPGGGLAEYAVVAESHLVPKPANISLDEAAAIGVAGLTALQGLRDWGGMKPGDKVLINGASGGVGTFAIQIAKALGGEVTAVCSTGNVDIARSLGADVVIDYTNEDFVAAGMRYDILFDGVGNRSLRECLRVLEPDGIYVAISGPKSPWLGPVRRLLAAAVVFRFVSPRLSAFKTAEQSTEDLTFIKELIEAGEVAPVIDRRYPLEEAAAALAHLGEGHAKGKIIVTI